MSGNERDLVESGGNGGASGGCREGEGDGGGGGGHDLSLVWFQKLKKTNEGTRDLKVETK